MIIEEIEASIKLLEESLKSLDSVEIDEEYTEGNINGLRHAYNSGLRELRHLLRLVKLKEEYENEQIRTA